MNTQLSFWFDIENHPDVLFFRPIVGALRDMNHRVYITTRNFSDVPDLARLYGLVADRVGWHGGKRKIGKVGVGLIRSYLLARWTTGKSIDLAVGFGSRPLAVACGFLRIKNATVFDYEHVSMAALNRFCDYIFVPEVVSTQYLHRRGTPKKKTIKYSGLKEEVYTDPHNHENGLLKLLACDEKKVIVAIRPPLTKAHYHDHASETICRRVLERISVDPSVQAIFLRRDRDTTFDEFLHYANIKQLINSVRGLDLIASSDLVISGGGTMVREAVAMGIPAYSIFTGTQGAVDEKLSQEGRLNLIRKPEDVVKIQFRKRENKTPNISANSSVLKFFVDEFIRLAGKSQIHEHEVIQE
jgi:predicted glycosyltransferase